jgi:glycosyltransferase involved in cell wall biosynthesis
VRTVGFLRHNFLPASETFIHVTLRALDRYRPRVFALRRLQPAKFPFEDVTRLNTGPLGWLEEALYRATTVSPGLVGWARSVDVLHAHMGWTGVHALLAARVAGRPLVTSFYGRDVKLRGLATAGEPAYWHFGAFAPLLFRFGDRFLVLSRHMRRALVARGCPDEKIRVVPLGVDLARFEAPRRRPAATVTVLMVGREVEKKGFADGLRACAAARDQGARLRVVVLGTRGPLRPALERLGAELRLDVAWPDPQSPVPRAMAEADVLLVPSRTAADGDQEGTPTVICEGSAAGLPVVGTRHAGIPEQVDDLATGLLAAEGDVAGLAAHLARLAGDPELRGALGRAGRTKMEQEYSLAALGRNVQAVYDEVLATRGGASRSGGER